MSSKKYYWLKLKTDFFNLREIKKLRKIAGGDTFTIIYLKMQLLSIKSDGIIKFEGTEEHFDHQLALELDEELDNVRLTLAFLHSNMLIEPLNDEDYLLPKVCELIGIESDSAERVRRHRNKSSEIALHCNANVTECNGDVTKCNTEIEIDLEKELELDIEKENNMSPETDDDCFTDVITFKSERKNVPYQKIMEMYNRICISLPRVIELNDKRKKAVKSRYIQIGSDINEIEALFHKVEDSDFLTHRNGSWSGCGFDWIMNPTNFTKIREGNYDNKSEKQVAQSKMQSSVVQEFLNRRA